MSTRHTGSNVVYSMQQEYHYHPFGDGYLAAQRVVQPLPEAFDSEKRLDYASRTDDNPVYIGFAEYQFNSEGTVVPTTDVSTWIIQKLTYDASDRITRIEVRRGTWDARTTLF